MAQQGVRRGTGKPAYDYELTQEAEALFPKAYEQVLRQLLTVLVAELGSDETDTLLRRAGNNWLPVYPRQREMRASGWKRVSISSVILAG